jgi:acetyl esterase/lipase
METRVYKKTPQGELSMFLHFPPGWSSEQRCPAIVFFFGGAWRMGDVDQFAYQAEYLASRGMVAARADYRVKTRHGTPIVSCVEDAKTAVRWVRANAGLLGVDPERIVAAGGSAGGHIAACAATIRGFEGDGEDQSISSRPNLLVLFNPVLDVPPAEVLHRIAEDLDAPDDPVAISPGRHLDADTPPSIMFYGVEDPLLAQAKSYLAAASSLGIATYLYTADGVGHAFFNFPPWLNSTLFLTDQFLSRHGYTDGESMIPLADSAEMTALSAQLTPPP